MVKDLLVPAAGLASADQNPPSVKDFSGWESTLAMANLMHLKVAWLFDMVKEVKAKHDPRLSKLPSLIKEHEKKKARLDVDVEVKKAEQK